MIQIKTYFLSNQTPIKTIFAVREKVSVPINEKLFNFQRNLRISVNFYTPNKERLILKTEFRKPGLIIKSRHLGKIRLPITSFFYDYDIKPTSTFLQYLSELGVSVS